MATLGTAVSYLDIASRLGPDHKISAIIEICNRTNRILDDMLVVQCNNGTGHQTTIRTGLPTVTWRILNYGVQPSKSTTAQITDTTGMLEAYAEVDKALADLNGNTAAWRLSEDQAFLEAMNQEMATTLFYGNEQTNPERFTGLMPRYPSLPASETDMTVTAYNVINAYTSASGADQTSVWLVVWGENTLHGLYPKGSESGGFNHQDLGEVTLDDAQSPTGHYQGYRSHYKWDLGLTQRDWRYVVRICNIDTSALNASTVDLITAMTKAYYRIPSLEMGNAVFYANNLVLQWLQLQAIAKTVLALKYDEVEGKPKTSFMGIPIKRCDALLNTEAVVT